MKKTIFMLLAIVVTGLSVSAQGGGMRRTPEERTKMVMDKFADWKLDKATSDQVDSTFTNFYRAQQKMMQDMRASGGTPDRDKMMADNKKLADERDVKLKTLFTADQFKKWKEEIEPSMRPQRGGGGGGNGGGNGGGGNGN
ncbi:MAG TPA: hypothetical protein VGM41_03890 [Chitinophagaceae bacterium]|jgi:hypothetical protein